MHLRPEYCSGKLALGWKTQHFTKTHGTLQVNSYIGDNEIKLL